MQKISSCWEEVHYTYIFSQKDSDGGSQGVGIFIGLRLLSFLKVISRLSILQEYHQIRRITLILSRYIHTSQRSPIIMKLRNITYCNCHSDWDDDNTRRQDDGTTTHHHMNLHVEPPSGSNPSHLAPPTWVLLSPTPLYLVGTWTRKKKRPMTS